MTPTKKTAVLLFCALVGCGDGWAPSYSLHDVLSEKGHCRQLGGVFEWRPSQAMFDGNPYQMRCLPPEQKP